MDPRLIHSLRHLNPSRKASLISPHKIALLLAVAQLYEEGFLQENRIDFSPELVATFQKIGQRLSPEYKNKLLIHLPLWHLKTSKVWHLKTLPGFERMLTSSNSPKSLTSMLDYVEYAFLSDDLYQAMLDPVQRALVRKTLIETYFPTAHARFQEVAIEVEPYLAQLELEFLNGLVAESESEMEQEIRSSMFKQRVPKVYNFRCAVSGMQVSTTTSASLVDACHIEPWSHNHNDTIGNGICLTPTIHRAFDRGLLSISPDYLVQVSTKISEDDRSPYALTQFHQRSLFLPDDPAYRPDPGLLDWHFREVFVG